MSIRRLHALARELYDRQFPCPICEKPVDRTECPVRHPKVPGSTLTDIQSTEWQCIHCEAWHLGDGEQFGADEENFD